ncbi:MAG: hypothetical protein NT087_02585 [Deltaproteobacteria bacterium]|nr:hypothetical protein [Deltaproteobacteria bacterium]
MEQGDEEIGAESGFCDEKNQKYRAPSPCVLGVFFCSFVVPSLLVVMSGLTMSRDISPTERQPLAGMKIPDEIHYHGPGWRPGSIGDVVSGWVCLGGTRSGEFVVDPCYRRDGSAALVTMRHVSSASPAYSIVVDVLAIKSKSLRFPSDVRRRLQWDDKKIQANLLRSVAFSDCDKKKSLDANPIIFALALPETGNSDCSHFTRRINQVWQLDKQSQRMLPVSPKGVFCWWSACLLGDTCKDEDQCNSP